MTAGRGDLVGIAEHQAQHHWILHAQFGQFIILRATVRILPCTHLAVITNCSCLSANNIVLNVGFTRERGNNWGCGPAFASSVLYFHAPASRELSDGWVHTSTFCIVNNECAVCHCKFRFKMPLTNDRSELEICAQTVNSNVLCFGTG